MFTGEYIFGTTTNARSYSTHNATAFLLVQLELTVRIPSSYLLTWPTGMMFEKEGGTLTREGSKDKYRRSWVKYQ